MITYRATCRFLEEIVRLALLDTNVVLALFGNDDHIRRAFVWLYADLLRSISSKKFAELLA